MSMTYKQIVDRVLADAFDEIKRQDAQLWVQNRLAWLWDLENWTFRDATASVTVTTGSQTVTNVPTDFGVVAALFNAQGSPLTGCSNWREFLDIYNANSQTSTGKPEAYTVVGTTILVGPKSSETSSSYLLAYEKKKPILSADGDLTGLPDGYDLALVYGGKAAGFKLSTIPGLADDFDADFQAQITALRAGYLSAVRSGKQQAPAYRPI